MPKQPAIAAAAMIEQMAKAMAKADGAVCAADHGRYRRLAIAALKPLAKPTDTMVDAAHGAVWSDGLWAINSRRDFQKAVRAMIVTAMTESETAKPKG